MAEALVDVDLDALAPVPKKVRLGGKVYRLPGDMPMGLFVRLQSYEQRIEKGESEVDLLSEVQSELLALFQVHQPTLKALPEIGVLVLLQSMGAIYGGAVGEAPPNRETRRQRKRTPSAQVPRAARARSSR